MLSFHTPLVTKTIERKLHFVFVEELSKNDGFEKMMRCQEKRRDLTRKVQIRHLFSLLLYSYLIFTCTYIVRCDGIKSGCDVTMFGQDIDVIPFGGT